MYPYGEDAGDSVITFDIRGKKCFKINIPDGGMAFFGKRHRKLYVSPLSRSMTCRPNDNKQTLRWGLTYANDELLTLPV